MQLGTQEKITDSHFGYFRVLFYRIPIKIPNLAEWDKSQPGNSQPSFLIGTCLFFKYPKISKNGNLLFFPVKTRPSSSEYCYPILQLTPQMSPYPGGAVNNRKLKQRHFWATHVNRKWSFFIFDSSFAQIFGQIISIRVKTLRNTNLVASRCFEMKKTSLPVDVRRSKTPLLKLPNIQWCFQWWPLTIFLNALWSIFTLQFWYNVLVNWSN